MILEIHSENPDKRKIDQVIKVLQNGGIIAYPTDTSYGIGCDFRNKKAIQKIYQLLRFPKNKQLSFLCLDLSHIAEYAIINNLTYKSMKRLIPGAYTFILDAAKSVPQTLLSKRKQVGIRVPGDNISQAIIEELGNPIVNATAKRPDGDYFIDAQEIDEVFGKQLDLIIETSKHHDQGASTVIDFTNDEINLVRKGLGDYSWIIEA